MHNLYLHFTSQQGNIIMDNPSKKATIISILNQKGGVGKTTTTVNLSHGLGKKGLKILVIDLDPQCNASMILGKLSPFEQPKTIIDLFTSDAAISDCIVPTKYINVDMVSSHMDLFAIKTQITGTTDGIVGLRKKLDNITISKYDYIFIDCQPDIGGALVTNALVISDKYIVPVGAEDVFGLKGIKQLETAVKSIKESINEKIEMLGVLITMADYRSNATATMIETINTHFKDGEVFKTIIKRNAAINTAFMHSKSIISHDSRTSGAIDYSCLADEFLIKVS